MTLRHYEIFKTVAETGNFTKAARKLYISQSGVSHAIRELETQAGTSLFIRLPKSVQLTESGKLLLREVLPILASCESLNARISHLEENASIHIVSCITIATFWLPHILRNFQNQWPNTPVEVSIVSAVNTLAALDDGVADLALIEGALPPGPYECRNFGFYTMSAVCAPDFPLPGRPLSIQEFISRPLLLREKGSALRDTLDNTLYLHGYTAHPVITSVNSNALLASAKAGLGLAWLPDLLTEDARKHGEVISIPVDGLKLQNELSVLYPRGKYLTEPLKALLEMICV